MSLEKTWTVPSHVPQELVVDFDLFEVKPGIDNPFDVWKNLLDANPPKIFWSPRNGGHWTFLTYEDIREGFKTYQKFSNRHTPIPPVPEEHWPVLQPQSSDPPDHAKYRNLLAPMFTPNAVRSFEAEVQRRVSELMDPFIDQDHCEFVGEFSTRMPTGMFLHVMGMDQPTTVDLDRQVNTHLTFGLGVHRCLGQHLARLEISTALREWLTRVHEFQVVPGSSIEVFAGPVLGLRSLPLQWSSNNNPENAS